MRTIKELLEITLVNTELFDDGLCFWVNRLYLRDVISLEECRKLIIYIRTNRPSKWSSVSAFRYRKRGFYWKEGNIAPRIRWLEEHIKLNS